MELLANQERPIKLSDIYGQSHLIGEGKILTNLVQNKKLFSIRSLAVECYPNMPYSLFTKGFSFVKFFIIWCCVSICIMI